jgi:MOSC domain-containing protein YiiM
MDGVTPERCDECGFDATRWRVRDAGTLMGALGLWWRLALAGLDAAQLNRRPGPGVWSALEYGAHSALVTAMIRAGLELVIAEDGLRLPAVPDGDGASGDDASSDLDPTAVLADLEREGLALAALAHDAPTGAWAHTGFAGDQPLQAEAVLVHAAHDASHHFMDVARGLLALGAGTGDQTGTVQHVNASAGGVPKLPVPVATVDYAGLVGDRQRDRKHHGRPFQALCLWSADVIDRLAADGHPIAPGSAGENVTIAGLDWSALRPGSVVRLGSALAEISFAAVPCKKQAGWFSDGDFRRIAYEVNPQWVRWYAWVRRPGEVRAGDLVTVQS